MPLPASIAIVGDSTLEDIDSLYGVQAVPDRFVRLLEQSLAITCNRGFFGLWRDEWSLSGTWTRATTSDAWDRGPLLGSSTGCGTFRANGASNVATWTKPAGTTVTSFVLHVIDGASAGQFAYRIDGGTWTNVTNTWTADNSYDRITVSASVSSTVEVRAANASGTATNLYLVGLEPVDSAATGPAVHVLAAAAEFSFSMVRTTSGSWQDWWNAIQPAAVWLECPWTNDVSFWPTNAADIEANMRAVIELVRGYGAEVFLFSFGEQDGRSVSDQTAMRALARSLAGEYRCHYVSAYDMWGTYSAANAAGLMLDTIHASATGTAAIGQWFANPFLVRAARWARFRA
jgi:hypothetical protein